MTQEKTKSRLPLLLLIIFSVFALTGLGCRRPGTGEERIDANIVVWGLWQDSSIMDPVVKAFTEQTGIEVEYKKIASVATYEKMLLEALAEGRGPDVFVIHHTWVEGKRGLMSPAPATIIDERMVGEEFVTVVGKDLVRDGFVYALPTSVDTMAMIYNVNALNAAGVTQPPKTWPEFQNAVEKITEVSRLGIIEKSATAMGTSANINRAPDILQLLMMQSGLNITGEGKVDIANDIGEKALTFFTDFSNKSKKVYTWDLGQDYSIDAFSEGETAMIFNYSYHIPTSEAKNQRLNFPVAPIHHIRNNSTPMAFANYWPFSVSNTSRSPQAAWMFVRYITSNEIAGAINKAQKAPPARRDSIEALRSDVIMGVFAEQTLRATSWPRVDVISSDGIFNTMIDEVATGAISISDALRRAEDQLEQIIQSNVQR